MLAAPTNKDGKRTYGGGSGTERLYFVEARYTFDRPLIIAAEFPREFVLDREWRRLPADHESPLIVPVRPNVSPRFGHDLVNYEAALALAYLFLSSLAVGYQSGCVECRIVEVELSYTYETVERGVGEIINRTDGPRPTFTQREAEDIALSARHLPDPPEVKK